MFKIVNKHELLRERTAGRKIWKVAASPREDVVACSDGKDVWLQQGDGDVTLHRLNNYSSCFKMAFSGDGEYLLHSTYCTGVGMSRTHIISLASGKTHVLENKENIVDIVVSKSSDDVMLRTGRSRSMLSTAYYLSKIDDNALENALAGAKPIGRCAFNRDGTVIWFADSSRRFHERNRRIGQTRSSDLGMGMLSDIAECDDRLYALAFDGQVAEIDKTTLQIIQKTQHGVGTGTTLVVMGKSLFVENYSGLCAVNFDTPNRPPPCISAAESFAPSFDGKHLYACTFDNKFVAYEVDDFDPDVAFEGIKSAAKLS